MTEQEHDASDVLDLETLPYIRIKHVDGNTVGGRLDLVLGAFLPKGWSLDVHHSDALHAFRPDAPAPSTPSSEDQATCACDGCVHYRAVNAAAPSAEDREALGPTTREKVAARIWRAVFEPAAGVMWSQRGAVPTEVADRCRAAAARLHADGLLAARQPAPVASAAQVSALADALRAEVSEHGSDGSTFEAVIRAWLGGDYDGPAPSTEDREALDLLDEMNAGGRIAYGDYSRLHDLIAARQPAPVNAETTTEWGVRWSEDCVEPHSSGEDACQAAMDDDDGTGTPVQRTVLVLTPWREVQYRG